MVKPIPEGYTSITPYLVVRGGAKALEWYVSALGARELFRMDGPGGTIAHAELMFGDSHVMVADEQEHYPAPNGPQAVGIMYYVENVDEIFARALGMGATEKEPVSDKFYGDRSGTLVDPFGHTWNIATHVEDVSPEELDRRVQQMHG